eukprot:1811658-Pyramimonas_sp.AAC.1
MVEKLARFPLYFGYGYYDDYDYDFVYWNVCVERNPQVSLPPPKAQSVYIASYSVYIASYSVYIASYSVYIASYSVYIASYS